MRKRDMIRGYIRNVLTRVAEQTAKNDLFEQKGERVQQEPVFVESTSNDSPQEAVIHLASSAQIEEKMLQYRVINHWATWCEGCVTELPLLQQLEEKIGAQAMLGISWDLFQGGTPQEVCMEIQSMCAEFAIHYPQMVVTDRPDQFFQHFDISTQLIPQTFVFSKTFALLFHKVGELDAQDIEKIQQVLSVEQ